jgi:hypothetical protein
MVYLIRVEYQSITFPKQVFGFVIDASTCTEKAQSNTIRVVEWISLIVERVAMSFKCQISIVKPYSRIFQVCGS